MIAPLVALAVKEVVPYLVPMVRGWLLKNHPDQPQPTEAEIHAAFEETFRSSLAIDDAILLQHGRRPQP